MRLKPTEWAAGAAFAAVLLIAAGAQAAPDPKAVADLLAADFAATGKATATYESATGTGDTVTITGFKATQTERKGRTITIATIVASGVTDRKAGGYTAARITLTNGSASYRGSEIQFASGVVDNAVLPPAAEIAAMKNTVNPFTSAQITGISLSGPELTAPVNIDHVSVTSGTDAEGLPAAVVVNVAGIAIPASALDSPEAQGVLQGLGYTDLVASITLDAAFDTGADTFTLNGVTLDIADVGKVTVAGKFSRMKIRHLLQNDPQKPGSAADDVAPMLDRLSLRIDNFGVVERALDMQAQLLGTTREDIAQQWPMLLMFQMGDAGGMDFQIKVQDALAAFLKSPKSLTVTLAPAAPVGIDEVEKVAGEDQSKLTELLGVDITANQ